MLGRIIKIRIFKEVLLLGRIMKIFISANLQRRPWIFKEFFMLGRMMKTCFISILQRRTSFFGLVE